MVRRLFSLVVGILAVEASLMAGSILDVSFFPPAQVSCNSTLSAGANSETLTLGACTQAGPVTFIGQPYVTAMSDPLEVAVDGTAGLESNNFQSALAIGASAEYDGSLEATDGTGAAFLEFDVVASGADGFSGDFAMPSQGIDFQVGSFTQRGQFMVPVTFGDPVAYSLFVQHSFYTWGEPDVMAAGISLENLEVVNANGVPIAGAEASVSNVPEPGTASLLGIGAGLLVFGRMLRQRRAS